MIILTNNGEEAVVVNSEFFSKVLATNNIEELRILREQLIRDAAETKMNWDFRMTIYQNILILNERILQLEIE
jgi:hypothetical protein